MVCSFHCLMNGFIAGTNGSPQENSHNNSSHHGADSHATQSKPADRVRCYTELPDTISLAFPVERVVTQLMLNVDVRGPLLMWKVCWDCCIEFKLSDRDWETNVRKNLCQTEHISNTVIIVLLTRKMIHNHPNNSKFINFYMHYFHHNCAIAMITATLPQSKRIGHNYMWFKK